MTTPAYSLPPDPKVPMVMSIACAEWRHEECAAWFRCDCAHHRRETSSVKTEEGSQS